MNRKSKKSRLGEFRSEFEKDVATQLQPFGFAYEPCQVPYIIERKYTPDFVYEKGDRSYLIECKGYFRAGDTQKYRSVAKSLPEKDELIFVLMKPHQRVNRATKSTMAQWCEKNNIKWYCLNTLRELVDYVTDTRRD